MMSVFHLMGIYNHHISSYITLIFIKPFDSITEEDVQGSKSLRHKTLNGVNHNLNTMNKIRH